MSAHAASDATLRAARAALAVGASLLVGAAFTAVVRVALPRALGPEAYGGYRIAESAAELVLILLSLGLDTTLRRDVAREPAQAGARLWDVIRLRSIGGTGIAVLGVLVLAISGVSPTVLVLFTTFVLAQLLVSLSNAHTATLHAVGDARWPAVASVAARALWAFLALGFLYAGAPPLLVAGALVFSEGLRLLVLHRRSVQRHGRTVARRGGGIPRAAWVAAAASLPIFINFVAHSLYARLGTWVLGVQASALEVGWYSAAANIAGVALLGMPLVTWILLPAAARAGAGSEADRDQLVVGALRAALLFAVPGALLLSLVAAPLVALVFGAAFAPAAVALARLAPTIGLAYLATIAAVSLIERGRERTVAAVSVAGLLVSVGLTLVLARPSTPGAAAAGAATAALLTECAVTTAMLALAWRRAWSAPLARTAAGLVAVASILAVLDRPAVLALPLVFQLIGLVVAVVAPLLLLRAIRPADLAFARAILRREPAHVVTH